MDETPKKSKVFIAIDPAMSNTGLAMWCEGEDEISTVLVKPSMKVPKKDFRSVYSAGKDITSKVGGMLRQVTLLGLPIEMMMEHPPPSGAWAAGLCLVDALILARIHRLQIFPYLAHPTRINTLLTSAEDSSLDKKFQRKTAFTKKERREYLFEILALNGLSVKTPPNQKKTKKLSYDETDAGLLLLYLVHNLHHELKLPDSLVQERWLLKELPCQG